MRTVKQKLQPSSSMSQTSKPWSTTQMKRWGHWPWKPLVLPTHQPHGQELTQMGQQKRQQKMAECSSSSPISDPSGSMWLKGSSQQITELKPTPCLQQPRPWTRKRDFLATQCFWLTAGPSCRVFNHQEGSRSSAASDRSCPCLRMKHLWPSSGSLIIVALEAMRKQISCQKWEANWSNLMSYSEANAILRNSFRTEWQQLLDIGTEEDSIHQLDRAALVTISRLRSGHSQLLSPLHRLKISHTDECPCSTSPQTPNHILQSCPSFNTLRHQTWPSPVDAQGKVWG